MLRGLRRRQGAQRSFGRAFHVCSPIDGAAPISASPSNSARQASTAERRNESIRRAWAEAGVATTFVPVSTAPNQPVRCHAPLPSSIGRYGLVGVGHGVTYQYGS